MHTYTSKCTERGEIVSVVLSAYKNPRAGPACSPATRRFAKFEMWLRLYIFAMSALH
jgi:hypothetical protein